MEAFRGPGPGGQKRNKTSSRIRLTHEPTGISVIAGESRSQRRNREAALRRLRHKMAVMLREEAKLAEYPNPGLIDVSIRNDGYPDALANVLDVMNFKDWSVSEAAEMIGVSTGRLVGFLSGDAAAWEEVNRQRMSAGLRRLNG